MVATELNLRECFGATPPTTPLSDTSLSYTKVSAFAWCSTMWIYSTANPRNISRLNSN